MTFLPQFRKMSSLLRRSGSPRATTSNSSKDTPEYQQVPLPGAIHDAGDKEAAATTEAAIKEPDANRKLSFFRATHRWDPNLSNETIDALGQATCTHDAKAEADLVEGLIENSQYPEASLTSRQIVGGN